MSEYIKKFKITEGNSKLMSFRIDDEKLFKNIKLFALRLKILEILNYMPYHSMMTDI